MTQKKKPQRAWSQPELNRALRLQDEGATYLNIARTLGRTRSSVAGAIRHASKREGKVVHGG